MPSRPPIADTLPVALVIPTHNRADLIAETLASALNQTLAFTEIVVIDDGSTDHTRDIVERHGARIRYVRTPNQGVQTARNRGIEATTSPLVVFLDSDDLLQPQYLETVLPWMSEHPEIDVVYANFRTFRGQRVDDDKLAQCPFAFTAGARLERDIFTDIPQLYERSLHYQPLFPSGMMARRSYLQRHGGYDPRFSGVGSEDWEFTLRAICSGQVALAARPLVHIRKHDRNQSRSNLRMRLGEVTVLEHSLQHHPGAHAYLAAVEASIQRRLQEALNTAFDDQAFPAVKQLGTRLRGQLHTKERLKYMIAMLPHPASTLIWRLFQ